MDMITVPSSLVSIQTREPMSPAMRAVIWEIGAALDEARIKAGHRDAVWLSIPTRRLRGEGSRDDNQHLRVTLDRLSGVYLTGEHKGDEWGAVILAEWHLEQGGAMARLFIPPAAVAAIQSPQTFAKIEARAAHSLSGHGRQLYVLLADKKNLHQRHWSYTVDELRSLMGCEDRKAYQVWHQFNRWVLQPALEQVNDFGTVSVKMTTKKMGRAVQWVRFDWQWKDPHDAAETSIENERHSKARRQRQKHDDAPPMIEEKEPQDPALTWWKSLTDAAQHEWSDRVGRIENLEGPGGQSIEMKRRVSDIAREAYARHTQETP